MKLGALLGPDVLEIVREDPAALREGLREVHPADVVDLLEEIPREDRIRVLDALDEKQLGGTLIYLGGETLREGMQRLPPPKLAKALDTLEPDDAARLLSYLPEQKRAPVLSGMSARDAAAARGLLSYEKGTAGRLMTGKFVKVRPEWTVGDTLEQMRKVDPEVATVADLYAVDDDGHLAGVVSLRKLLPAPPARTIGSLMTREVVSVPPDASEDEVARLVSKYGFNALPVVADGKAIGVITADDVIDVLVARETESALRMGGVEVSREPWERGALDYFGSSVFRVVRTRIWWLLLLFVTETLTGTVLRHFEDELAKVVALSFFIPLIIGTGGNAGSQTVSTIIRALALGQVRTRDALRVLFKETSSGFLLGVILCVVAAARSLLWGTTPKLALVVGLTILAVCAWANIIGALVPIVAQKMKIDPTVVSAPMISTVVDATGLAIYMLIAKVVLDL
jgi:magnesium transporter